MMSDSFIVLTFLLCCLVIPTATNASSCNEPCQTMDDCAGQLICINSKCNDLQGATKTCTTTRTGSSRSCNSNGPHSPPIAAAGTPAILTLNDFAPGGDGGVPPQCDHLYHPLPEKVVALSTGWFRNRSRCGMIVKITARNGRSSSARVVDECDSVHGCDKTRAYKPPCKTNIVAASATVWGDLQLDTDKAQVAVTWSFA